MLAVPQVVTHKEDSQVNHLTPSNGQISHLNKRQPRGTRRSNPVSLTTYLNQLSRSITYTKEDYGDPFAIQVIRKPPAGG